MVRLAVFWVLMSKNERLSAAFIGEGSLLIQCAKAWLDRGHEISLIITPDTQVAGFSSQHDLRCMDSSVQWQAALAAESFDYLFSVVNSLLLPAEVLQMPARLAINYHDSPLPRYAGLNATSWAIINGETEHAISWHVMVEELDAGDILIQRSLPISPNETSVSLNTRCYELAADAFADLIAGMETDSFSRMPQDLSKRTVFGSDARPAAAASLRPDVSFQELDALVRGLDFGPYANPLGKLKLFTPTGCIWPEAVELKRKACDTPGTVLNTADGQIRIALSDVEVSLSGCCDSTGKVLSADQLKSMGVYPGADLAPLTFREELEKLDAAAGRSQAYWVRRLTDLMPLNLSLLEASSELAADEGRQLIQTPVGIGGSWALSALLLLLGRLADEARFDIGLIADDLYTSGADGLINYFMPIRPLRLKINRGVNAEQWHDQVEQAVAQVRRRGLIDRDIWRRYPQLEDHASVHDLFQVVVGEGRHDLTYRGKAVLAVWFDQQTSQVSWSYDPSRTHAERISNIIHRWQHLCAQLSEADMATVDVTTVSLLLLEDQEAYRTHLSGRQAVGLSQRDGDTASHAHYIDWFTSIAKAQPEHTAVIADQATLNYSELDQRSQHVAQVLASQGVGRGDVVAICLPRSTDLMVAILAVMRCGAAFLPLDASYPVSRLEYMIEKTQAAVILSTSADKTATALLKHARAKRVDIEAILANSNGLEPISFDTHPSDLAYVIFTSGSTGQPKGVMIEQHSLTAYLAAIQTWYDYAPDGRQLACSALGFDSFLEEVLLPLVSGVTLVLRQQDTLDSPMALIEFCEQQQISVCTLPTAFWHEWALELARPETPWPSRLSTVVIGGEAAQPARVETWRRKAPQDSRLVNTYGPTETTIAVIACDLMQEEFADEIPLGYPVGQNQLLLLDRHDQLLPPECAGELHVAGPQLARGYFADDQRTAESFVEIQSLDGEPVRTYRTGDQVSLNQGLLYYHGRKDFQLKLRGFRVEPGEIEKKLNDLSLVQAALVTTVKCADSRTQLAAYIVPSESDADTAATLRQVRQSLSQTLPEYMLPAYFTALAALPLTPAGKLDRRSLPKPQLLKLDRQVVPPRNDNEKRIAELWQSLLDMSEPVGISDSLLDLGGHSLLATRAVAQLESETGTRLPLQTMMLGSLAQVARALNPSDTIADSLAVQDMPGRLVPKLALIRSGAVLDEADDPAILTVVSLPEVVTGPGVVICPPVMTEYMRAHVAMRRLADRLADLGRPVIRFDYLGTGDSSRDMTQVRLSDWLGNISDAITCLQGYGVAHFDLVGIRLGALLAAHFCQIADKEQQPNRLVLWDPVRSGLGFLRNFDQTNISHIAKGNRYKSYRYMKKARIRNSLLGYEMSLSLLGDLRSLDWPERLDMPVVGVNSADYVVTAPLDIAIHQVSQDIARWQSPDHVGVSLKANSTVDLVVSTLVGS